MWKPGKRKPTSPTGRPESPCEQQKFCPTCGREVPAFANGPRGRPNARCPLCQSLERHRFLAVLVQSLRDVIAQSRFTLEIAPTPCVTRMLRKVSSGAYLGTDLDPDADGRRVQVVADLTRAPFRAAAFDLLICFHVFEHIPDDRSAMGEFARLMSQGGIGFIQNPWRPGGPTIEDPEAPAEERVRRFGQADHVRLYGDDFEDRLRSAGISTRRVMPETLISADQMELMGIRSHPIWIATGKDRPFLEGSGTAFENDLRTRAQRLFSDGTWPPGSR